MNNSVVLGQAHVGLKGIGLRALIVISLLCLTLLVASEPPIMGKDAQYYWQSGSLWAHGKVSYAGSHIGSRVFAVLYYYCFQWTFGQSIDTVSLAMATLFLVFGISIIWLCYETLKTEFIRVSMALVLMLTGLLWIDWRRPQTEPFIVILAIVVLALTQRATRASTQVQQIALLAVISLLCGMGLGFRTEALILFAAVLVVWLFAELLKGKVSRGLLSTVVMVSLFMLGSQMPGHVFRVYTGLKLPPQLTGYFVFFKTVESFGDPNNGPASSELNRLGKELMQAAPQGFEIAPIRLGLSGAFSIYGPRYASDLYTRAGIETVKANASAVAADAVSSFTKYMWGRQLAYKVDRSSNTATLEGTRKRLAEIDQERAEQSKWRFNGDYHWPTSTITNNRLPVHQVLGAIQFPHIQWSLPAWVVTLLALSSIAISARTAVEARFLAIAMLSCLGSLTAAALTQGFVDRYWSAATLPVVVVITLFFFSFIDREVLRHRNRV